MSRDLTICTDVNNRGSNIISKRHLKPRNESGSKNGAIRLSENAPHPFARGNKNKKFNGDPNMQSEEFSQ